MGRKPGYISNNSKQERNDQLVKLALTGVYSLKDLSNMFDITRERVRQIYKKATGKKFTVRLEARRNLRKARLARLLNLVAFNCKACKRPVRYGEKSKRKVLCNECNYRSSVQQIAIYNVCTCDNCGKEYNPKRTVLRQHKQAQKEGKSLGTFCTTKCYREFRRKIRPEELRKKKEAAHQKAEQSKSKKKTKIERMLGQARKLFANK